MDVNNNTRQSWPKVLLVSVILLVAAAAVAGLAAKKMYGTLKTNSEYQAVFLTNGQVYFGKLSQKHGGWIILKDIYYLQVTQNLQQASGGNSDTATTGQSQATQQDQQVQLVKLGSELHGPEDEMFIARDKILFWENMSENSKVLNSIRQAQGR